MKIRIEELPEAGLELSESCPASVLDLNRADIKVTQPISLFARIAKGANVVSVKLAIEALMQLNCSRCLEEFTASLSKEVNLSFPISNKSEIDLTDNLREEIILSYPLKPLCRPDCRGLCPFCGANLNKGKCGCRELKPKRKER